MIGEILSWLLENAQLVVSFSFLGAAVLSVRASVALFQDARQHRAIDHLSRKGSLDHLFLACLPGGMVIGFVSSTIVYFLERKYEYNHLIGPALSIGCSAIGLVFVAMLYYVLTVKLRLRTYPEDSFVKRLPILWLLRHAGIILTLSGVLALVCAYYIPTPDPRSDLTAWGWGYRTAVAAPGIFYTAIAALLFARASKNPDNSVTKNQRWRYAAWGSAGFGLLWINLWIWPVISLYPSLGWVSLHSENLERLFEAPIFAFFGLSYAHAFLPRYRTGTVDQRIATSIESSKVCNDICAVLAGANGVNTAVIHNGLEQMNILSRVTAKIRCTNTDRQLALYALQIYAAHHNGILDPNHIKYLNSLARRQLSTSTEPGILPRAAITVATLIDSSQRSDHVERDGRSSSLGELVFLVFASEDFGDQEARETLASSQPNLVELISYYRKSCRRDLYGFGGDNLELPAS